MTLKLVRRQGTITIVAIMLSGCCSLPDFKTAHERYVDLKNSKVGNHVTNELWFPNKYRGSPKQYYEDNERFYEVVEYNGEMAYRDVYPFRPVCSTVEFVSVNSLKILGWEYAPGSDPNKCITNNYCRAW